MKNVLTKIAMLAIFSRHLMAHYEGNALVAQLVECLHGKEEVIGSNPIGGF